MTAAAILGNLVDAYNVNTHKVMRLSIDVPAENANQVLDAFGWPTMVNPVQVAVARVDLTKAAKPSVTANDTEARTAKPKRSWDDLSPAEQAGIRCGEDAFRRYIREREVVEKGITWEWPIADNMVAALVRQRCAGIQSRSVLNTNPEAAAKWRDLEIDYQNWLKCAT